METRLLPHVFAQNAATDPNGLFARIPTGQKYSDGFRDISKSQISKAIDLAAHFIECSIGKSEVFRTVAYIGPTDLRYTILLIAATKTGHKAFFSSPRNSVEAHVSLFEKTDCDVLFTTDPQPPCVSAILKAKPLKTVIVPSMHEFLAANAVASYPYNADFENHKRDPTVVLHTSGSTGLPKPLVYTHEYMLRVVNVLKAEPPSGFTSYAQYLRKGIFLNTFPTFHIGGMFITVLLPAYFGCSPVYPLPGPPPTSRDFVDALENTTADWAVAPPVVVDEIGRDAAMLDRLASRIKYLVFGGGAVPEGPGDRLAAKLPLWTFLGSSENGVFPLLHPNEGYDNSVDWQYMYINPALGMDWRHHLDSQYELTVKRIHNLEDCQPVFSVFPELTEYPTRDLFIPHPTKDGFYAYQCRVDDIIVFLNGEKTNPVSFEEAVLNDKSVKACLVLGAQRLEAGLLIEPASDRELTADEKIAFVDKLWPTIQGANSASPAHAQVSKTMVVLADPSKPFSRAGKGTVQRNATLSLYADVIDELYRQSDDRGKLSKGAIRSANDNLRSLLRTAVVEALNWDETNFFDSGMDSLLALRLQRALRRDLPDLTLNTIYANPSIAALTRAIQQSTSPTSSTDGAGKADSVVEDMMNKYFVKIDELQPRPILDGSKSNANHQKILLTGSTGSLGCHILNTLLANSSVERVYCFNRTTDAQDRQIQNFSARRLDATALKSDRVVFVHGDLSQPRFGLAAAAYQRLASEITRVIHNAWPVDFNLPLNSFVPSLDGVMGLIAFAVQAPCRPHLQFVSSIGSVANCKLSPVPEQIIVDTTIPAAMGYGQSKFIAERMLDRAARKAGISVTSVRVGQIAGAGKTASGWNRQEWFPSMVISSALMQALPSTLGSDQEGPENSPVTWVPVDNVASILVDLCISKAHDEETSKVRHIIHPGPLQWDQVAQQVKSTIESTTSRRIRILPYSDWLELLRSSNEQRTEDGEFDVSEQMYRNPAIKLLDFFGALSHEGTASKELDLDKTKQDSETMQKLQPLQSGWLEGWVREWMMGLN